MTWKYRYRKQILIGSIIFFFLVLLGGCIYFFMDNKKDSNKKNNTEVLVAKKENSDEKSKKNTIKSEEGKKIMVDVKGFVNSPGIYSLNEDSRVIDAINMAGGITEEGDTSVLNLSKKLEDEMVIIVYSYWQVSNFKSVKEETKIVEEECKKGINEVENDGCIQEQENNTKDITNTKISINNATLEELMMLEGVGEAKAKSIIEYREKNGLFQSIEDLLNVSGIGESLFAKIKENITL